MSNKLQELTDKLYQEGLSKGKAEGEQILADAKKTAEDIVAAAKAEAEAVIAKAQADAAELRSKTESDVRMASSQALQATKNDIEKLVVGKVSDDKVKAALSDVAFIKEIIKAVAAGFSASEAVDIALVLPESLKAQLEPWVKGELAATLGKGVSSSFTKKISGGFTIGPADGSYFISLTDETFSALISEYLRPVTRKFLFGE